MNRKYICKECGNQCKYVEVATMYQYKIGSNYFCSYSCMNKYKNRTKRTFPSKN